MLAQNMVKLTTILPEKPFQKWGLYFIKPVKSTSCILVFAIFYLPLICYQVGGGDNFMHQHSYCYYKVFI
jgi:hypothetical protein